MRKLSLLMSTIVVLALLLTACGGEETTTSVPSTNVPPITVEVTSTQEVGGTQTPATTDLTTTPGVPVTGENNPSRLSNLMNMALWNQNNEQVGEVQDLVLDLDNTRIAYLVVSTAGFGTAGDKTILVPWDSVQLQASAASNTSGQGNGFVLLADPEFLNNAPETDVNTILPGMGQPAGNWDTDIRNFWESGTMPSSTQSANTPSTGTGTETAVPEMTATPTASSSGTNQGQGQGLGQAQNVLGVVLASDVIGSTIMIGAHGQGQGQGQGLGQGLATAAATSMPNTTATASTGGTGGTGTGGTGNVAAGATQATVEDLIIDPATGDIQYLVIRTADDQTRWIPVPIGFLRWDATSNGFILMIDANALQNAPAFSEDQFPDASTTGWDSEFSTFWQSNGGTGGTGTGGTGTGGTSTTPTATP